MASQISSSSYVILCLALLASCFVLASQAKLLGSRQRFYDDPYASSPYGPMATGERAIVTIRGARNTYDGYPPAKLALEHNSYRGPYPTRGIYDRLDMGRPYPSMGGYPMSSGPMGYPYPMTRRRDSFFDPDYGVKASLRLGSKQKSRCRFNTHAGSEIPELGLDVAKLGVNCDFNPAQLADGAVKVARKFDKLRRDRQRAGQRRASSMVKRKRTRIVIDREYEKDHRPQHNHDHGQSGNNRQRDHHESRGVDPDDDDDD